tara:strand:+ start:430 stop:606 length:177 start_codon:yes stop_codon:yes gene_type:complete
MTDYEKFVKALSTAQNFGIASLNQMAFFLEVAKNQNAPLSILDLSSTNDAHCTEYKFA